MTSYEKRLPARQNRIETLPALGEGELLRPHWGWIRLLHRDPAT